MRGTGDELGAETAAFLEPEQQVRASRDGAARLEREEDVAIESGAPALAGVRVRARGVDSLRQRVCPFGSAREDGHQSAAGTRSPGTLRTSAGAARTGTTRGFTRE